MSPNKSRRRVPDQLRKRASISCDFCKIRRRKCIRLPGQVQCKLCTEHGVQCASTIPRKPRGNLPGDEEPSSPSFYLRAIEEIVHKLFPGVNISDRKELQRLSQQISDGSLQVLQGSKPPQHDIGVEDNSISNVPSSNTLAEPLTTPSNGSSILTEQVLQGSPPTSFYERILQSPAGILSYFGPSSSMAYVRKMRELIASETDETPNSDPSQGLRYDFIKDHFAHTMGENQGAVPELPAPSQVQSASPDPTKQAAARLLRLLETLPPKEETDELVELFFAHVHINMALFHRPSFHAALDRLRSPHTRTVDAGWAVCLQLAVAFGCEWRLSLITERNTPAWERLNLLKRQFVNNSFLEVSHLVLSANLQSVSALALLSVYMSFANERNASWILSGCAIRMAIGLGLHRGDNVLKRSDLSLPSLETELRKQIWCSLYILDQYTSAFLGRPSAVHDLDVVFDYPKESILDQGFYWPPGYLQKDVLLARIVGRICQAQVDQSLSPSNDSQGLPNLNKCHKLLNELENWKKSLPPFLEFNEAKVEHIYPNHLRQIIMMHVRYQYARILLCRPFLLKVLYIFNGLDGGDISECQILKYKDICLQSAVDAWGHILSLWKRGQYNANLWLDGVFAYQCNLILGLYFLDTSKPFDPPRSQRIQNMVRHIQDILHREPGNRTMGRLKQISRDFSEIVSNISGSSRERSANAPERNQGETTNHQNRSSIQTSGFLETFPAVPQSQEDFALSTLDFENILESNIFNADFLSENPMFGSFSNFPFENMDVIPNP